eukprot:365094-Chlamydomonas_euryale.AAC.8
MQDCATRPLDLSAPGACSERKQHPRHVSFTPPTRHTNMQDCAARPLDLSAPGACPEPKQNPRHVLSPHPTPPNAPTRLRRRAISPSARWAWPK